MDLNMCKTLSTCTDFEKSVPGPSTTINSDNPVQSRPESKAEVIVYLCVDVCPYALASVCPSQCSNIS